MKTTKLTVLAALILCGATNLLFAQNWAKLETSLPKNLTAFWTDVVDKNPVWTVHDDGYFVAAAELKVSRTLDAGATWETSTVTTEEGEYCTSFAARSAQECWVMTYNLVNGGGKMYVTRNGGQTWQRKAANAFTFPGSFPDVIHFWSANEGFALGDPGDGEYEIYRTADAGETWARVNVANIADPTAGEFALTQSFGRAGNTFMCPTSNNRLLKSTDFGLTWTAQDLPSPNGQGGPFGIAFSDAKNGLITYNYNNFEAAPTPGANADPIRTTDGGLSWQVVPNSDFSDFDESGLLCYVPGTDGTFVSSNFDGWAYTTDYGVNWKYFEDENMRLPSIECLDWQTCYGGVWAEFGSTSGDVARFIGNVLAPKGLNTPYFSVKLWPNPTDKDLNVGLYAPYGYDITCYLHNATSGKVVATGTIPAGSTSVLMDCSAGDPGVYSLRMVTGKRVQTAMVFLKMY